MKNQKLRKTLLSIACLLFSLKPGYSAEGGPPLHWPAPPAETRIAFVKSVRSHLDFGISDGFSKKLKGIIFGEKKDVLSKPLSVAVDSEKTVYVCDPGASALYIFDQKRKKGYKKITSINKETLLLPVGIAVSENGLIFLSDSLLKKVFCLDKSGKLKFTIGQESRLMRPTGLTICEDKLYVVDTLTHSVLIFDLKGNFLSQFGSRGKEEGRFNYPTAITSDADHKIYITDTLNFRIQVFDRENKFLYSIGQVGDGSGFFFRPKGVAIDSFGHIYSTDGLFDNVQIFNSGKEFLLSFGETGSNDGEFWIPSGIAIDKENTIYVADSYNQRIQIFRYIGKE